MSDEDSEGDVGHNEKLLKFVLLIKGHSSLINKSQLPAVKKLKELAAKRVIDEWAKHGELLTEKSLFKKINNMKARIKKKTDVNQTGNKRVKLLAWEKHFMDMISADDNPTFNKIPGAVSTVGHDALDLFQPHTSNMTSPSLVTFRSETSLTSESMVKPPESNKIKRKIEEVFNKYETDETKLLSNTQLSRLVMLQQLAVLKQKRVRMEMNDITGGLD